MEGDLKEDHCQIWTIDSELHSPKSRWTTSDIRSPNLTTICDISSVK